MANVEDEGFDVLGGKFADDPIEVPEIVQAQFGGCRCFGQILDLGHKGKVQIVGVESQIGWLKQDPLIAILLLPIHIKYLI